MDEISSEPILPPGLVTRMCGVQLTGMCPQFHPPFWRVGSYVLTTYIQLLEVSAVIPNALDLSCDISLLLGNVPYGTSSEDLEYAGLARCLVAAIIHQDRSSESAVVCHDNEVEEETFDGHHSSERDTLI